MMKRWAMVWLLAVTALLALRPAAAVSLKEATGALFAASDGNGQVQLLWFPPAVRWPSGWRVLDSGGKVLAQQVTAGEGETLGALSARDAESIRKLREILGKAVKPEDTQLVYGFLGARALSDWNYAQALGLARSFKVPPGRRSYVVEGLDGGKPNGVRLTSEALDSAVATPPAAAPRDLRAEPSAAGVALYWTPAPAERMLPVIAYQAERDSAAVSEMPVVRGSRWNEKLPALVDPNAPLETELSYRVYAVDLFGRRSAAAMVKVFAADLKALEPPVEFSARAGNGEAMLSWKGGSNPHTSGYVLERAFLHDGPYEVLTPRGIPARTEQYVDKGLRGGTLYHYRIRAMNTRGDLGVPSRVATAQPSGARPASVSGLRAEAGRSRVHLSWQALDTPVAGYFIERTQLGKDAWIRLNPKVRPETDYDDYSGLERAGGFGYRIVAVGFDNQESRPGNVVEVALPDTRPPAPPMITGIDGQDGKVVGQFAPVGNAEVQQFLIVRASAPDDPGIVIGDPLPGSARSFEDDFVDAGQSLLYRVVAVDKDGNRSEPGNAVAVRVGAREIAPAARPEVAYSSEPFPHAVIRFAAAPDNLATVIQYRAGEQGPWVVLAGPVSGNGEATQANLPAGALAYRAVYQATNGMQGKPSEAVALSR